jgi:hypothetical protein
MILPLKSKLHPVLGRDTILEIDGNEQFQREEYARCMDEPWYWLVNYVYSIRKDEFNPDSKPQVLRFPPKEHLRIVFHKCFEENYLVVDKSRQLTFTWLFMAYLLYLAQFGKLEDIIVQTKKETDADENLIKRAQFMANSQRPWLKPQTKYSYCRLRFLDNGSAMRGLPGGPGAGDQIRSANPSRYFLDEGGFVDEFEDCRTAALACCRDVKIVSTANYGEFQNFIEDNIAA